MKFVDMHCDTLMKFLIPQEGDLYENSFSVDFKRMREAGCLAQFFAFFMIPDAPLSMPGLEIPRMSDDEMYAKFFKNIEDGVAQYNDIVAFAHNYDEIMANDAAGKSSVVITFEDGRAVDGKMENLKGFYDRGIRLISLTWNYKNCFGSPNSLDPEIMGEGLTPFGKEAIGYMNELGIIIDVSHLSDGGFWDVATLTKKPFVASHSNARALSPHQRNLTDEMIRALADKGGCTGINFAPGFLNEDIKCQDSTVELMVKHIKHIKNIGGIDAVALGSDLDGITGNLEVDSISKIPNIFDALEKEGFGEEEIEKFARGNVLRVIKESMK